MVDTLGCVPQTLEKDRKQEITLDFTGLDNNTIITIMFKYNLRFIEGDKRMSQNKQGAKIGLIEAAKLWVQYIEWKLKKKKK
jgi:hypothetical protein